MPNVKSPSEVLRLLRGGAEPTVREQCNATLRACRRGNVLPIRYPVPALVAEMLERMSVASAKVTVKAMMDILVEMEP